MEEKIYTENDLVEIYSKEFREILFKTNQGLWQFEKDELLKKRKIEFLNELKKIKKIKVFIDDVIKIKIKGKNFLDVNSKNIISQEDEIEVFRVRWSLHKLEDLLVKQNYYFPMICAISYYTVNPEFNKFESIVFEIKYSDYSFNNNIDNIFDTYKKSVNVYNVLPEDFFLQKKSNLNCFVVTATMGDINHPVVNDFRNYRDDVLSNTILGRLFIKVYYQIGPYLSEIIKRNNTLFRISRNLVLKLHKRIFKK
jgi:hypothetical protein